MSRFLAAWRDHVVLAVLLLAVVPPLAAQTIDPLERKGQIVFVAHWNSPTPYAKAFGDRAQYRETSGSVGGGQEQHPNLKSAALRLRAWSTPLLGDFFTTAEFAWEINDQVVMGSTARQLIAPSRLAKYPSLLKRLKALRPSRVEAEITVGVRTELPTGGYDPKSRSGTMFFRVAHGDLVIAPSGVMPVAGPPLWPSDWRTTVSMDSDARSRFTSADRSVVNDMKTLVRGAQAMTYVIGSRMVSLKIEWPLAEIDEIIGLYEKYEREGKKIDDDFAALKPDFKPPAPPPYTKGGELAKPYEEEIKTAEVFSEPGRGPGLRAKNRVVMQSAAYGWGRALPGSDRYFQFDVRGKPFAHLYDAKGRRMSIGSHSAFTAIGKGPQPDTWLLMGVDENSGTAYTTRREYSSKRQYLSQADFNAFTSRDGAPIPAPTAPRPGDENKVSIGFATKIQTFSRGTVYVVDARLRVILTDAGYH